MDMGKNWKNVPVLTQSPSKQAGKLAISIAGYILMTFPCCSKTKIELQAKG